MTAGRAAGDHRHVPAPVVGRVYVRSGPDPGRPVVPPAYPGPAWRQLGLLSPQLEIAAGDEVMVIIDVDRSSASASLSATLPERVDVLQLHGIEPPSRAWLQELPGVAASTVGLDTLPAAAELALLGECGPTLTELRLGRRGTLGARTIAELGFLSRLPRLHSLALWGVDLRGSLDVDAPLNVEHLVAGVVPAPDRSSWPWQGLGWLERFPRTRSLTLAVPSIDPLSLRHVAVLVHLESLRLSLGRVTSGAIAGWRTLAQLRELRLADAKVDPPALEEIARLPALRKLELGEVPLGDHDLRSLAAAPALEDLSIDAGNIAADIGLLAPRGLRHLRLPGCTFEGSALAGLDRLVSLRTLDLTDAEPDGRVVAAAAGLPALRELALGGCDRVSFHALPDDGRGFRSLRSLDISGTDADAAVLRMVASLPRLDVLRATDLLAVSADDELAFARSLTSLHLDRTALGRTAPRAIAACAQLETLSLRSCPFDAEQLGPLAALTRLSSLGLTPRAALPAWLDALPLLEELTIDSATVTGQRLAVLRSMTSLVRLELSYCRLHDGAWAVIAGLADLQALALAQSELAQGDTLGRLPAKLRDLNLTSSKLGDEHIADLSGAMLESLTFFQSPITPGGLLGIGDMPRLDRLNGVLALASEDVQEQILARFPACWTLLSYVSVRRPLRNSDSP